MKRDAAGSGVGFQLFSHCLWPTLEWGGGGDGLAAADFLDAARAGFGDGVAAHFEMGDGTVWIQNEIN